MSDQENEEKYICDSQTEIPNPVKVLIYNISHADLCLTIQPSSITTTDSKRELIARPRSSSFNKVCTEIVGVLKNGAKYKGITYPDSIGIQRYVGIQFLQPQRICSWHQFRLRDKHPPTTAHSLSMVVVRVFFPLISAVIPKWMTTLHSLPTYAQYQKSLSANFCGSDTDGTSEYISNVCSEEMNSNEEERIIHSLCKDTEPMINDIFSSPPAMNGNHESMINNAHVRFHERDDSLSIEYKIFLVSGAGHAMKDTDTYQEDDSTEQLSNIILIFLHHFFPSIIVQTFFSGGNIFHYMANIRFVQGVLRPAVDRERGRLAAYFGNEWKRTFHLAITLCDGTPARLSSIVEGMRVYAPDMLHVWKRKSLWNGYPNISQLWTNDVDYLRFDQMKTQPPIPIGEVVDKLVIAIVEQMRIWKDYFIANAVENAESEIDEFWLRKSHQPVLAIVAVQKPNYEKPKFYRGVNIEVSLPTGSLCAERNAIGSALADDPSLRREHFKMVAVLFLPKLNQIPSQVHNLQLMYKKRASSVPNVSPFSHGLCDALQSQVPDSNPIGPCGSCEEWLKKIAECNPCFSIVTFSDVQLKEVIVQKLN